MVNLRRLRYFVVVTEELNFVRATQRLHVAHSLLGYQIRHLEDESEDGERLNSCTLCRVPPNLPLDTVRRGTLE
jgi:hypothetical protein